MALCVDGQAIFGSLQVKFLVLNALPLAVIVLANSYLFLLN